MPLSTLVSSKKDSAPVSACQWTKMNLAELTERQKTERLTDWLRSLKDSIAHQLFLDHGELSSMALNLYI